MLLAENEREEMRRRDRSIIMSNCRKYSLHYNMNLKSLCVILEAVTLCQLNTVIISIDVRNANT